MARKKTTTIRIDEETRQRLEQLKIDLATSRRLPYTMDSTIRELIAAFDEHKTKQRLK